MMVYARNSGNAVTLVSCAKLEAIIRLSQKKRNTNNNVHDAYGGTLTYLTSDHQGSRRSLAEIGRSGS